MRNECFYFFQLLDFAFEKASFFFADASFQTIASAFISNSLFTVMKEKTFSELCVVCRFTICMVFMLI